MAKSHRNTVAFHLPVLVGALIPMTLSLASAAQQSDLQEPLVLPRSEATPSPHETDGVEPKGDAGKETPPAPIRVACIGDSITYGMGLTDRARDSYPAVMQRILGPSYQVRNFGRSGADVLLINNGPYANTHEHREALAFQPDIVICNLGINDHALVADNKDAFVRDYLSLLEQYARLPTKPRLIIWTDLAPVMPGQKNYAQCAQLSRSFASLLRQVAERAGATGVDMRTPLAGHPEWFPDHLHPNAPGAEVIARVTEKAVATPSQAGFAHLSVAELTCERGFEGAPVGPCERLRGPLGVWQAEPGNAEINADHVRSGDRSLRLNGGENRVVRFSRPLRASASKVFSCWCERWTARGPFRFRIEQRVQDTWVEVYDGDREVRVGGFHTHVVAPLRETNQVEIRFLLSTPDSSGLLVDDVDLVDAEPMRSAKAVVDQPTLPALIGAEWSAISRLRVDVEGNQGVAPTVESFRIATSGSTALTDMASVRVFYTGSQQLVSASSRPNAFFDATPFGEPASPAEELTLRGSQELAPGANYFWIACRLTKNANIDNRVNAVPVRVQLANGANLPLTVTGDLSGQRMGVAVRRRGDDGVHTYRIPGLATTNHSTLIGVYDIRRRNGGDLPGDIDVGMSRSTDGGRTWEPMQVIMDLGSDPQWGYDGVGDPAVLVDRRTNTIWVAAVWSHGNRGWNGSQPGLEPSETGQLMLVRSDDDGLTWSDPINITSQVKRAEWCFLLQGPGKGITMQDGTLVFAAQYQDTPSNRRLPRSTILYSRDHGSTWSIGAGAYDDTTEAQVVELRPGELMLNCRYNRAPRRVVVTSSDMGKTWQEHPSSRAALGEPGACMASLIGLASPRGSNGAEWLLFSNPNNPTSRRQMTIKASGDRGITWQGSRQLLLDEAPSAGYSCMTMLDPDTVGILYEGSQAHMTFQRIPTKQILELGVQNGCR